jgi:hypothetical protein
MKKVLILLVLIVFLLGVGFSERIDAAVCDACNASTSSTNADCRAPASECRGDLSPDDGKKQGVCQEPGKTQICNPLRTTSFVGIINNILTLLFNFALVLSPIMIVVAGIMFVTAGGSPDRVSTAKRILLWTVVGFVIVILARGLIAVLRIIIGI